MRKPPSWLWWLALLLLWLLATAADRAWLAADQRLPAWDQADYLNSAVDHGRALGLLPGGRWQGWAALLDLSPKIPPLASLVGGTVMAVAGDSPDAASWALSLWHGLLLLSVAGWGRELKSPGFGLLAAALTALAPALTSLRVEYTLDIPLTACSVLALWLLWRWQRPGPHGGHWPQALLAAAAVAAALLVKQSALLVLAPPTLWACAQAWRSPQRRWQSLAGLGLVLLLLLPWLHHNWITTLGGTERAVVSSGAQEGDPGSLDPRSLSWYPRLWPQQLGAFSLAGGLAGLSLLGWQQRALWPGQAAVGWPWLVGCTLSGWLFTSLSPNKDPRYIAPLLPLLALLLARGWWAVAAAVRRRFGSATGIGLLGLGLLGATAITSRDQLAALQRQPATGVPEAMAALRQRVQERPTTLLIAASSPDLNEHTLTFLGRAGGGQVLARRLGRSPGQAALALEQAHWWLLASGNQGTSRRSGRRLSQAVRHDPRFQLVQSWPWSQQRRLELWQRRSSAPQPASFASRFIQLARGLEQGPRGLEPVFNSIGTWHQLDPRFSYQAKVQGWALAQLARDAHDRDALWSLALLGVLQNRPQQADHWFSALEQQDGRGGWASTYRSVVLLANWNSCGAARVADSGNSSLLRALRDLGRSFCLDPRGPAGLIHNLPSALQEIHRLL